MQSWPSFVSCTVYGGNIGMDEGGGRARFAQQALPFAGAAFLNRGEEFQRERPLQLGISCLEQHAHATGPERRHDLVRGGIDFQQKALRDPSRRAPL